MLMGLLLASTLLPQILMGLIAGVVADRFNRKRLLIAADITRGMILVVLTFLERSGGLQPTFLFAGTVTLSLATAFYSPAVKAVLPQLLEKEQLMEANALSQAAYGITTLAGPVIGASLVTLYGYPVVLLLNAASFFLSGILEGFIRLPQAKPLVADSSIGREAAAGFRYIFTSKPILTIIAVIAVAHLFVGSLQVLAPLLAVSLKGNGVQNLGFLETAMGVGLVAGSVCAGRNKHKMQADRLVYFLLACGFCLLLTGAVFLFGIRAIPYYLLVFFAFSSLVVNASILWQSLLQANTPNEMAGRVFSAAAITGNLSLPLSYALFGMLLNTYPLYAVLLFSGGSLIVIGICFIRCCMIKDKVELPQW